MSDCRVNVMRFEISTIAIDGARMPEKSLASSNVVGHASWIKQQQMKWSESMFVCESSGTRNPAGFIQSWMRKTRIRLQLRLRCSSCTPIRRRGIVSHSIHVTFFTHSRHSCDALCRHIISPHPHPFATFVLILYSNCCTAPPHIWYEYGYSSEAVCKQRQLWMAMSRIFCNYSDALLFVQKVWDFSFAGFHNRSFSTSINLQILVFTTEKRHFSA